MASIERTPSSSVLREVFCCSRIWLRSVFRSHDILLLAASQSSVRFSRTTAQVHPSSGNPLKSCSTLLPLSTSSTASRNRSRPSSFESGSSSPARATAPSDQEPSPSHQARTLLIRLRAQEAASLHRHHQKGLILCRVANLSIRSGSLIFVQAQRLPEGQSKMVGHLLLEAVCRLNPAADTIQHRGPFL